MSFITLFLLSIGLAMDAFAVSITNGLRYKDNGNKYAILSALSFGLAQGIMPIIGYFAGSFFVNIISSIDHWIIVIILSFIGGNMIYGAIKDIKNPDDKDKSPVVFTYKLMLIQAIATSIDALSVGVGFAALDVDILVAGSIICIITFICCVFGVKIGAKFGTMFKEKAEIFGGVILVFIGAKIFLEHIGIIG